MRPLNGLAARTPLLPALLALLCLMAACAQADGTAGPREGLGGPGGLPEPSPSVQVRSTPAAEPTPSPGGPGRRNREQRRAPPALVTRVVDGDTIEVAYRGRALDVRLIGVDTPETVHPSEGVECYGRAASRFTTTSLEGARVRLEFDVQRLDPYGRTLAYVWKGGTLFNEALVSRGYAVVDTFPPNVRYVERFLRAQRGARSAGRGLWSACPEDGGDAGDAPAAGGDPDGTAGTCDPSYPGVCIAPYPPDLDCSDVPYTSFRVVGADPHGFDGEGDGRGCET